MKGVQWLTEHQDHDGRYRTPTGGAIRDDEVWHLLELVRDGDFCYLKYPDSGKPYVFEKAAESDDSDSARTGTEIVLSSMYPGTNGTEGSVDFR